MKLYKNNCERDIRSVRKITLRPIDNSKLTIRIKVAHQDGKIKKNRGIKVIGTREVGPRVRFP